MFKGQFEHNIDEKGRTSLPAKFREILVARGSDRLVVTADREPRLLLYPLDKWHAFEEKLNALPQHDHRVKLVKRLYIGNAHEVGFDAAGRMLIPASLRRHAGLDREVVIVGQIEHVEVWNRNLWQQALDEISSEDFQEALDTLGV